MNTLYGTQISATDNCRLHLSLSQLNPLYNPNTLNQVRRLIVIGHSLFLPHINRSRLNVACSIRGVGVGCNVLHEYKCEAVFELWFIVDCTVPTALYEAAIMLVK
jgi:hypothetical protein